VSEAPGTLLPAPTVTVATTVAVPVQPEPANLLYVTEPVTPVDGNPPDKVADRLVGEPVAMGDVAAVVMVGVCLFTVTLAQVPVAALLLVSPP
jgi:hypothetical protein